MYMVYSFFYLIDKIIIVLYDFNGLKIISFFVIFLGFGGWLFGILNIGL